MFDSEFKLNSHKQLDIVNKKIQKQNAKMKEQVGERIGNVQKANQRLISIEEENKLLTQKNHFLEDAMRKLENKLESKQERKFDSKLQNKIMTSSRLRSAKQVDNLERCSQMIMENFQQKQKYELESDHKSLKDQLIEVRAQLRAQQQKNNNERLKLIESTYEKEKQNIQLRNEIINLKKDKDAYVQQQLMSSNQQFHEKSSLFTLPNETINKKIQSLTQSNQNLVQTIQFIKKQKQLLNQKIQHFYGQNQSLKQKMQSLESQQQDLNKKNQFLTSEHQSKNQSIASQMQNLNQKIQTLLSEKQELRRKIQQHISENRQLKLRDQRLKSEKQILKKTIQSITFQNKQSQQRNQLERQNLKKSIKGLTSQNQNLEQKIQSLSLEKQDLSKKIQFLTIQNQQFQQRSQLISSQKQDINKRIQSFSQQKQDLSKKLTESKIQINSEKVKSQQLRRQLKKLEEQNFIIKGEIQVLNVKLDKMRKEKLYEINSLKDQLSVKEQQERKMKQSLDEAIKQIELDNLERQDLKSQIQSLNSQISRLKQELTQVHNQIKDISAQSQIKLNKNSQLKDNLSLQLSQMRFYTIEKEQQIVRLKSALEESERYLTSLKQKCSQFGSSLKAKDAQIIKLQLDITSIKKGFIPIKQNLQRKVIKLAQQLRSYQNPRTIQERFSLIQKWFKSPAFQISDKVVFMNWTEQFFLQLGMNYTQADEGFVDMLECVKTEKFNYM